MSLSKPQRKRR